MKIFFYFVGQHDDPFAAAAGDDNRHAGGRSIFYNAFQFFRHAAVAAGCVHNSFCAVLQRCVKEELVVSPNVTVNDFYVGQAGNIFCGKETFRCQTKIFVCDVA